MVSIHRRCRRAWSTVFIACTLLIIGMLSSLRPYPIAALPTINSPILHLRLDEAANATTFVDSSTNGHTGTCSDNSCPTMGMAGKVGSAAMFNGSQSITIPNRPSLEFTTGTFAAWVRPNWTCGSSTANPGILAMRSQEKVRYSLHINQNCQELIFWNGIGPVFAPYTFVQGNWYYIAMTYAANTLTIYVNGTRVGQGTIASSTEQGLPLHIGKSGHTLHTGVSETFTGNIDDVRLYSEALSETDIAALMQATLSTPVLHLRLDEATNATTFADSSSYGHTGTCSGKGCPETGIAGKVGSAATFTGNEAITIPNHPSLELTAGTIAAWVRPAWTCGSSGANPTILAMSAAYYSLMTRYSLHIDRDCDALIVSNNSTSVSVPYTFEREKWYHIAVTEEEGTLKMYVNSVPLGQETLAFSNQRGSLHIGAHFAIPLGSPISGGAPIAPFIGSIDEVRLSGKVLGGTDIVDLMQNTSFSPSMHLPLDESPNAATFADASKNGHTGTCSGNSCPTAGETGKIGAAVTFNGSQAVTVPNHPSLEFTTGTFVAWVRPAWHCSSITSDPTILAIDDQDRTHYRLHISRACNGLIVSNGSTSAPVSYTFEPGTWYHIAVTEVSGTLTLYVNGTRVGQGTIAPSTVQGLPLHLGASKYGSSMGARDTFIGSIDEVRFYNSVMSPEYIAALARK